MILIPVFHPNMSHPGPENTFGPNGPLPHGANPNGPPSALSDHSYPGQLAPHGGYPSFGGYGFYISQQVPQAAPPLQHNQSKNTVWEWNLY